MSASLSRTSTSGRPLVVLSGRPFGGERPGWGLPESYLTALDRAGLAGVVVGDPEAGVALLRAGCGLLLPGGPDVDPARYAQPAHETTVVNSALDELEFPLLEAALEQDRPVLGICRGVQVLNVALGGTLVQDLASERPGELGHRWREDADGGPRDAWHPVELAPESRVRSALGETVDVTSAHHQGLDRLGAGLRATGWAPDGLVEAVEVDGPAFVVGVQFHPERMPAETASGLFEAFATALREAATVGSPASVGIAPAAGS